MGTPGIRPGLRPPPRGTRDLVAEIDHQLIADRAERNAVTLTIAQSIFDGDNDGHIQRSPDPDMRWWNATIMKRWGETPPTPLPGDQETKSLTEIVSEYMQAAMEELYRPSPLWLAIQRGVERRATNTPHPRTLVAMHQDYDEA